MSDGYKEAKEAFVSGMTGSSIKHVNVLSLAALVRFFTVTSYSLSEAF